jgi:iron(III) transport system substrate-binding protein
MIDRRQTVFGLGALGVVAMMPRDAKADLAALEGAARKEATLTWYVAQHDAERSEAIAKQFTADYPGIAVSVIRTTGQVAYQRLTMDIKNHTPQCDVFSTTDISHMPVLKDKHELTSYTPENAAGLLPPFARLSDPGYSYITNASRYFLIYNTQKVPAADAPKAWTDLLDPKWKGKVALGHPAFSGCTGTLVATLRKQYGWEFFEKLAKNNPRVGRSAVDPVTLITAGECLVGPASATSVYPGIDKGSPLGPVHPADGLVVCIAPSAIPANAPHPNAARLFMEWMLGEHYSHMVTSDGGEPLRAGVDPRKDEPLLSTQKILQLTVAEIRKDVPEVIEQWRDTFGS